MRTHELAEELGIPFVRTVANKIRSEDDLAAVKSFCAQHGMKLMSVVPHDEAMVEAERRGTAPFDFAPDSPGVAAIRKLASDIEDLASPSSAPPSAGKAAGLGA